MNFIPLGGLRATLYFSKIYNVKMPRLAGTKPGLPTHIAKYRLARLLYFVLPEKERKKT